MHGQEYIFFHLTLIEVTEICWYAQIHNNKSMQTNNKT